MNVHPNELYDLDKLIDELEEIGDLQDIEDSCEEIDLYEA